MQNECGSIAKFCPEGSTSAFTVQAGFFSACDPDGDTSLCTETTRVTEVKCGDGYVCAGGRQSRAIEFHPDLCTCVDEVDKTSCYPTNANKVSKRSGFPEMEAHLRDPFGAFKPDAITSGRGDLTMDNARTWSTRVKATWAMDGETDDVANSDFEIRKLKRDDRTDTATRKPCSGLSASAVPPFRLGRVSSGNAELSLKYLLDYEDCLYYTFDLVAKRPASKGGGELACHFAVTTYDRNDRPYWHEDVDAGFNEYGDNDNTVGTAGVAKLTKKREVFERSERSSAFGDALDARDIDDGQELTYSIIGGNDDGFFRINSCSGQLYVNKEGLDYNTKNAYQLTIGVKDDPEFFSTGGLNISDTLVDITILDKNDIPVICYDKEKYPTECGTSMDTR